MSLKEKVRLKMKFFWLMVFALFMSGFENGKKLGNEIPILKGNYYPDIGMVSRNNEIEKAGIFSGLGSPQEIIGGVVAFIVLMIAFPMALSAYFNVSTSGWDSNTISIWNLLGFISVAGLVVGVAAIGYSKYKNR